MKVLHVISGLRSGGAEHFVLDLCRRSINDDEIEMSVLTLSGADDISYKFREAGIEVLTTSVANTLGLALQSGSCAITHTAHAIWTEVRM